MTEIVNLGKVRKARARVTRKAEADANAVKFGRTKSERELADAQRSKAERYLDNKRLDDK